MKRYSIAGLKVEMDPHLPMLTDRSAHYLSTEEGPIDITVPYREDWYIEKNKEHPQLNRQETEYVWSGEEFYLKLLLFGGFMLHASAVVHDGFAYLFSAPSGTGKSTHTSLWLNTFADSFILNDDKPAIRLIDGRFYACGTPFSGKTNLSENVCVPIKGICFLHRSPTNEIKKCESKEALKNIMNQTVRPSNALRMVWNTHR